MTCFQKLTAWFEQFQRIPLLPDANYWRRQQSEFQAILLKNRKKLQMIKHPPSTVRRKETLHRKEGVSERQNGAGGAFQSMIQTRSIERVLAPIAAQVSCPARGCSGAEAGGLPLLHSLHWVAVHFMICVRSWSRVTLGLGRVENRKCKKQKGEKEKRKSNHALMGDIAIIFNFRVPKLNSYGGKKGFKNLPHTQSHSH